MRKVRWVAIATAVALGAGALAAASSSAGAAGEAPKATEVGITATEIHIAVVADVDNTIRPGLFQDVVNGVKGFGDYINSKAGGKGLAGRKVVVDFIDSHLNPTETRNATIKACENDQSLEIDHVSKQEGWPGEFVALAVAQPVHEDDEVWLVR